MKTTQLIIFLLFTSIGLTNCSQNETSESGKQKIVVTTGMIGDIISNIVGDSLEVTALMGPGVDPHQYTAVQSDLRTLQEANIIFYNGLHLEGKMVSVFEKMGRTKPVYALSDGLEEKDLRRLDDDNAHDPHIWMDVALWHKATEFATEKLCDHYPTLAKYFKGRASAYMNRLLLLDQEVKKEISSIPESQRVLITAHDAFSYFGAAYNIEVVGLQGISTVSEAGIKQAQTLANLIIDRKITAIFVESSVPTKRMERLVESCRESGHEVRIGGNLYSDAMGVKGSDADSYEGMIRANVKTIVDALK